MIVLFTQNVIILIHTSDHVQFLLGLTVFQYRACCKTASPSITAEHWLKVTLFIKAET